MDADGSFSLKNLGKNSIFLNGREIATGELLRFASSNLIEVNGFPYLTPDLVELFCHPSFICSSFCVYSSMLLCLGSSSYSDRVNGFSFFVFSYNIYPRRIPLSFVILQCLYSLICYPFLFQFFSIMLAQTN